MLNKPRRLDWLNTRNLRVFLPSIIVVIVLLVLGQSLAAGFVSVKNMSSILMTASILIFAMIAQSIVMISGNNGIDLSVGAVMSMTALLGPTLPMGTPLTFALAILAVMGMGAVCGLLNGAGIQFFKIPPLIMTLIMSNVIYGFTMFSTKGQPSLNLGPLLLSVSKPVLPLLRVLTLIGIAAVIAAEIVLLKTRVGRTLMIAGDNPTAANLCGVKIGLVSVLAYASAGAISGFAGLMLVGYAGSAIIKMADGYTLLSIAAAIIGGTSIAGGRGSFVGGALGAMVLVILNSILQVLRMPEGARYIIQGTLLAVILLTNTRSAKLRQ
ncbi:MAG: ABC transporter permease [Spirochaetaceae bacterium]|jgi:ribose transport system permease protein|nr:ABC transporter permease [Spirochaetaceae bacterium]